MLRALAIIIVSGGCAMLGVRAAGNLKRRQDTLQIMLDGCRQLAMWMPYTMEPLQQLMQHCKKENSSIFWDALIEALNDTNYVPDAWHKSMVYARSQDKGFASLEEAELQAMAEFAQGLGNSDRATQAKNMELLHQRLADILRDAQEIYGRKGRIYRSMGILSGIAAAILLL